MSDEARSTRNLTYLWLGVSVIGISVGGILWLSGSHDAAHVAWAVTTWIGLVPLAGDGHPRPGAAGARRGLIALLAMAGALALGECWPAR